MTRTINIRGRKYTVVDEPRLNGEIAPHLYNSKGRPAGVLDDWFGWLTVLGCPKSWSADDVQSAVRQILA